MIHRTTLSADLLPTPAPRGRDWWDADRLTVGHAKNCLPLLMANTLGYVVRSPGTFEVSWSGDWNEQASVTTLDASGVIVDAHAAGASFTVQPGFAASTTEVDAFLMLRPVANVRGVPFSAMEALIEAWWQPGEFGVVCLLHRPGTFVVQRGDVLAQMCVFTGSGGSATLETSERLPEQTEAWRERRGRYGYVKDLDYFRGRFPDGSPGPFHRTNWRSQP